MGFEEGAAERLDGRALSPILTFQGRGILFLLCTVSFHFHLTLCATETLHELRTQSSGELSGSSLPPSCFLASPQLRPLARWPSRRFVHCIFVPGYLCKWNGFSSCVFCTTGAKDMETERPHLCLHLSVFGWVLKYRSFQVTFLCNISTPFKASLVGFDKSGLRVVNRWKWKKKKRTIW